MRKMITMGEDQTIEEYLDNLRGRIQVKLAGGVLPPILAPSAWSACRWLCA